MVSKAATKYSVKIECDAVFLTNNTKDNVFLNGVTEIQPSKKAELKTGFILTHLTFSADKDAVTLWNFSKDWTIDGKNFTGQLTVETIFSGTVTFKYGAGNYESIVFRTLPGLSFTFG